MRKQVFIEYFERRSLELSCPKKKLRSKVEELSDYHDFLKRTAVKEGLSDLEAESQASSQLGDPIALAEEGAAAIRQASWWGRHPIIGFILLPLVALWPAFLVSVLLMLAALFSQMTQEQVNGLFAGRNPQATLKEFRGLIQALFAIHYIVLTFVTLPFTWMARRSASGMKWVLAPCLICAAQGMFFQLNLSTIQLSYQWTPNLLGGIGPLLIVAGEWWRQSRLIGRLPELPAHLQRSKSGLAALMEFLQTPLGGNGEDAPTRRPLGANKDWFKKALRTPTYWVMTIIVVVVVPLMMVGMAKAKKAQIAANARRVSPPVSTWQAEREAAITQVQARQATKETAGETTIDLSPYINTQLSDSVDGGKKGVVKDNHLLDLPRGIRVYGGVPFDVEGRIQLMGRGLEQWERIYPVVAKNIKIEHNCSKIHLFHGQNCSQQTQNQVVAKLILHYEDRTQQEIQIKTGVNVLDWWGPIYTTQVAGWRRFVTSPDSELAWVGQNPFIKRFEPQNSLRLYKSTFENPQPNVKIATIDYVSTMTSAAPFMLGLTVE